MAICKEKLDGVVVWYNPTEKQVTALQTYIDSVRRLFIIDNSNGDNSSLLQNIPSDKYEYLPSFDNLGIATALNIGCKKAIKAGAEWILTMDQDSRFLQSTVDDLIAEAQRYDDFDKVGVFSPFQDTGIDRHLEKHARFQPIVSVMTSGNLLCVEAFVTIGGFRDEFFIDLVDDDFCCCLHEHGYQVLRLNTIILTHCLGSGPQKVKWMVHHAYIRHNALRHYYIIRNMLKMLDLHPEYKSFYKRQLRKRLKRTLLYDSEHKCQKIKYMYKGWCDYRKNQFGPISD